MPEILLLALAVLLLPILPGKIFWVILVFMLVLPGTYALFRGPLFLPTRSHVLKTMIAFAKIKKNDRVYDLGCGDGRLVFAAAREGARATGYELSIPVFVVAKIRSFFYRGQSLDKNSGGRATIRFGNFWAQNYDDADVIVCFLLTDAMLRFEQKIWPRLKPGCRVVSHMFRMKNVDPTKQEGKVVLYIKLA